MKNVKNFPSPLKKTIKIIGGLVVVKKSMVKTIQYRYSVNGEFLGLEEVRGNMFHLCNVSNSEADAAWVFGTR